MNEIEGLLDPYGSFTPKESLRISLMYIRRSDKSNSIYSSTNYKKIIRSTFLHTSPIACSDYEVMSEITY